MDKIKAGSSLNCCVSLINKDNLYEVEGNEEIQSKSRKNSCTDKYLVHIILNKLKSMILGIDDAIKEINDIDHTDYSYESFLDLLSTFKSSYPFKKEDLKEIEDLSLQVLSSGLERDLYLEKNFSLLYILSGYLLSEEYSTKIKQVEKYLYDNFFIKELYPPLNQFKENLILDLDETLIHSESPINPNKSYHFKIEEKDMGIFVRAHLKEFLESISNEYNLILFSAGSSDYVKSAVDIVGIGEYFSLILTRECCCSPSDFIYIKDIEVISKFLNHKLKYENNITDSDFSRETIIVDNNIVSFAKDLNKGILVNDFLGIQDKELIDLYSLLIKLKNAKENSNVTIEFLLNKINDFVPQLKRQFNKY